VATGAEQAFISDWLLNVCAARGIKPIVANVPENVEVTIRYKDDAEYLFVLNHNAEAVNIDLGEISGTELISGSKLQGSAELAGRDVWIVKLG